MRQALEVQVQSESLGLHPAGTPSLYGSISCWKGPTPRPQPQAFLFATLPSAKGRATQTSGALRSMVTPGVRRGKRICHRVDPMPLDPLPRPQPSPWTAATPFP